MIKVRTSPSARLTFALAFVAMLATVGVHRAQAQTFNVVYNFTGGADGGRPLDGFTADPSGNLYATSFYGGTSGDGAIFKMPNGSPETVLYSFAGGSDGENPEGGLLLDKSGNLYGTTTAGGASSIGTVFMLTPAGVKTTLYNFKGGKDGSAPQSGLAMDLSGNLYGTTTAGGTSGNGTVFQLVLSKSSGKWAEAVLYSFGTGNDGTVPVGGLALDKANNLYGTCSAGGAYGYGTVFQLMRSGTTWKENILHTFALANDGGTPYAGLVLGGTGIFYGAATDGGTGGGGTVFKVAEVKGSWVFSVIYSNPGWGISGSFRNMLIDPSTKIIYGTTHCDGDYSAGTVYKLTPSGTKWTFTQLYQFTGGSDGLYSFSNPVLVNGTLYGTTNLGGQYGSGVIWEVIL